MPRAFRRRVNPSSQPSAATHNQQQVPGEAVRHRVESLDDPRHILAGFQRPHIEQVGLGDAAPRHRGVLPRGSRHAEPTVHPARHHGNLDPPRGKNRAMSRREFVLQVTIRFGHLDRAPGHRVPVTPPHRGAPLRMDEVREVEDRDDIGARAPHRQEVRHARGTHRSLPRQFAGQERNLVHQARSTPPFAKPPHSGFQVGRPEVVVRAVLRRAVHRELVGSVLLHQRLQQPGNELPHAALGGADLHGIECDPHHPTEPCAPRAIFN